MRTQLVDYNLQFRSLTPRSVTDLIVLHHTGGSPHDNFSALEIHQMHLNQGWAGIGYHFVIREDGTVEVGRPIDCVGAHAEGDNYHSIGVHICGNFEETEPAPAQIESCSILVCDLTEMYSLINNRDYFKGHRELMATACPGENLFSQIPTILGKAEWYRQNS